MSRGNSILTYNELQAEFERELDDIRDAAKRAEQGYTLAPIARTYTYSTKGREAASMACKRFGALSEAN